jgi:hypothetical protein
MDSLPPAFVVEGHPSSCSEGSVCHPSPVPCTLPPLLCKGSNRSGPTPPSHRKGRQAINKSCNSPPRPSPRLPAPSSSGVEGRATWLAVACIISPLYLPIPRPPPGRSLSPCPGWLRIKHDTTPLHLLSLPTPALPPVWASAFREGLRASHHHSQQQQLISRSFMNAVSPMAFTPRSP